MLNAKRIYIIEMMRYEDKRVYITYKHYSIQHLYYDVYTSAYATYAVVVING